MTSEQSLEARPRDGSHGTPALMLAAFGPPAIALVYQSAAYALMHLACMTWITWPVHVVTLLAVAGTVSGTLAGLRHWRRRNHPRWVRSSEQSADEAGPAERERRGLIAIVAVSLGSLSTLSVALMWVATLIFAPCQQ